MREPFTPIFASGVVSLLVFHNLKIYYGILFPFIIVAFGCALLFFILGRNRLSYGCIALSLVLLLTFCFLKEKHDFRIRSEQPIPGNQYITIRGRLVDYPEMKRDHSVITVRSESLEYHGRKVFRRIRIRIRVNGNLDYLNRGDAIVIHSRLFRNRAYINFCPSPLENYVLHRRFHFRGFCKSQRLVRRVQEAGWPWRIIGSWRNRLRSVIEKKWRDRDGVLDRRGVFLEAILMGERGQMTSSQRESLLDSGIYHLFAISGAHIGIITLMSLFFLKFLGLSLRGRVPITLVLLILFLALSGFKVSALRAVIMAGFILMARLFRFGFRILNIISLSGLFILFVNPLEILDPGFILTYALTVAIVIGRGIFIPLLKRAPRAIGEMVSANLTACLVSLPLSLHFFKRYSFAGFLAGLALLPLTAVIIGFGLVMLLAVPFSISLATAVMTLNGIPLSLFFMVVDFFSRVVNLGIFRASPSLPALGAVLLLFAALNLKKKFRFQKGLLMAVFLASVLLLSLPRRAYRPSHLEVYFLDVGQGDCQLVVFPGGDSLLIDGGGSVHSDFEVGRHLVMPFLLQKRVRVKWVAVSHFHPDHCRGITEIINIIKPEQLWISCRLTNDGYYRRLMETLDRRIVVEPLTFPFYRRVGGCAVSLLAPRRQVVAESAGNNQSQVIRISDRFHSFLFTGDIENPVETLLARRDCSRLPSTVLKVPHHGSRTSSSGPFLDCVQPRVAVFSFGRNNGFGFPHPGVLERLKDRGIRWLTTARNGGIRIISRKRGLEIEVSR